MRRLLVVLISGTLTGALSFCLIHALPAHSTVNPPVIAVATGDDPVTVWHHPPIVTTTTSTTVPRPSQRPLSAPVTSAPPVRTLPPQTGGWVQPWACIAEGVRGGARWGNGESGGNPAENTGNGYWGGLQFVPSTWWAYARPLGITVPAYEASIPQQEAVADRVLAAAGWGQWPETSAACGFR